MKKIIIFILTISPLIISAQEIFQREKRDNIWLFGGRQIKVDFNTIPVDYTFEQRQIRFDFTNASICDTAGNLLLYTNGISISNASHDTIENGGRINPGEYSDGLVSSGNHLPQGALILPIPDHDSLYCILYGELMRAPEFGANFTRVFSLHQALVNMNYNDGLGKVLEKDILILEDTLEVGKIVTTRHANGRDWWVVVPEYISNKYYIWLLTNEGLIDYGWQEIGENHFYGLGQSSFSPSGKKYIHYSIYHFGENYLSIFDFDRCTGEFSNPIRILDTLYAFSGGAAISENSRFLYVSSFRSIYQYDLEAENIEASRVTVAEYDGYYDGTTGDRKTYFYLAALAPDGKIYVGSPTTVRHLHVIEEPDKKGLACNVRQHFMELPTWNNFTMPNVAYYGLGPLDGSPCDTLNINNPPPEADFVYVVDSLEVHDISFYNSTLFSPEATDFMPLPDAYVWSFGDGEFSNERHPFHTYAEDGTYEVCLTATNMGGSDTFCDTLYINVVATEEVDLSVKNVKIHPNPVSEVFYLGYLSEREGYTVLFDSFGREVQRRQLRKGNILQAWKVRDLASGVYYLQGIVDGQVVFSEKVVKI